MIVLALAAGLACGGPASPGPSPAPGADSAGSRCELRVAEAIHADSVWPVEKQMCRTDVPPRDCHEVCRAAGDLREVSLRMCRGLRDFADDPTGFRRCREGRALAKRADTACSYCSGSLTRRPCPEHF
jgi:hypothetical protein